MDITTSDAGRQEQRLFVNIYAVKTRNLNQEREIERKKDSECLSWENPSAGYIYPPVMSK